MKDKRWIIGEYDNSQVDNLSRKLSISPLTAKLLIRRGLSNYEDAEIFLKKEISGFHSPFLMKDMEKAVNIIKSARESNEKVLIWGDYDVDGVTSTTILLKFLLSHGIDADYYIPRRLDEGYGLNKEVIESFAKSGGSLLITVDCGITADEEIAFGKSLGLKIIVTDHHECRDTVPDADAVVNPKRHDCAYPFKELAGVGVAFKLICACEMVLSQKGHIEALEKILKEYADLASIGTIADVMPIHDENRLIVARGLTEISNTKNVGLDALIDEAGIHAKSYKKKKISSTTIGFVLAPKINAAGRIGTSRSAVELFMTDSLEKAATLASELSQINKERQLLENEILCQAIEKIESEHDFENEKIIILCDNNWHHGVIGIVASRITEKYNLPAILISFKNEGHEKTESLGKGSGRSIRGLNIIETLGKCSDILLKYGGHELAAGLSIDRANFDEFKYRMNEYAKKAFENFDFTKSLEIDCEVGAEEISIDTANEISTLEPFGLSNPVPLFCVKNMLVCSMSSIGENKHTKIVLKKNGRYYVALFFGKTINTLPYIEGDFIDVVFNLDVNNFKNQQTVQLIVRDTCLSKALSDKIDVEYTRYLQIKSGNTAVNSQEIPTREDFRAIYSLLKNTAHSTDAKTIEVNIPHYSRSAMKKFGMDISVCKILLIFDIFEECEIIKSSKVLNDLNRSIFTESFVSPTSAKVELNSTEIMKNLLSRQI